MPESVFEIIGPAMIGPSSSHTAGAVRIGLMARRLLGSEPRQAAFGLHGSFAATGAGHATDRGLVAGVLGFAPDDERLKSSRDLAAAAGVEVSFSNVDLGESAHPNSVTVNLTGEDGTRLRVVAASVGGGSIEVSMLDDYAVQLSGSMNTLAIWHQDQPGFLSRVTAIFACVDANIATIQTARRHRASEALTAIELDAPVIPEISALLHRMTSIRRLVCLLPLP